MKWKVAEPIDGGIPAVYPDTGKMEFPIATKPDFIRADVWAKHVHLIAAAPCMFAALGELIEAMHRYEMDVDADAPAEHREMMRRAYAALAKASPSARSSDGVVKIEGV